jgi:outer membrane protein assembly factor BamA
MPLAALPLAALLSTGCASRPQLRERVGRVRIEGNGTFWDGTGDFHVRQAMEQEKAAWSTPVFLGLAVPLDRDTLAQDAWRIELWYAHHGYLDARFLGWDIRERKRARRRRPAVMDITGRVEEGEPSLVRELRFEGLDLGGGTGHRRYLERNASVQAGDVFTVSAVDETEDLIRGWLREHSFAWVDVQTEIVAYPEQRAVDLLFRVEPGVACRFGEVSFEPSEHIPDILIRDQLEFEPGKPFKASSLGETRRKLFGLGTFSMVEVTPVRQPEDPSVVPVRLTLTESRFRRLRLGGGFGAESGKQDAHVSVGFQHVNLYDRLIGLDLDTELGAATIASLEDLAGGEGVQRWAPEIDSGLELSFPRIFGKGWIMRQSLDYEMGLESSYTFYQPSWQPSVSRVFEPRKGTKRELGTLTLTSSYTLSYFDFIEQDVDLSSVEDSRMGLDLSAPYILSYVEEAAIWDVRDDPLFTTRGMYLAAALGMAGGFGQQGAPLFGNFDFVKAYGDLRGYTPLGKLFRLPGGVTLASRLAGGFAQPVGSGDRASVPYAERFLIGGGNTVRGWRTDWLGPRICEAAADEGGGLGVRDPGDLAIGSGSYYFRTAERPCTEGDPIPIGGQVYGFGTLELRKPLAWGLSVAGFVDVGMAWANWAMMKEQWPLPSVGGGIRYKSPVGPVRLDFAYRLDDDPLWDDTEYRWNLHFSLSEAF